VNLASRLSASAADSQILIDRVAAHAIGSSLPLVELETRALKGFDQPVRVFAPLAPSSASAAETPRRPAMF
jgi:class 3 adenylate cyclase